MTKREYELRIRTDGNAATAEIVSIEKGVHTVVGAVTTAAEKPISILRFEPLEDQPFYFTAFKKKKGKSWIQRLKPEKIVASVGLLSAQWSLKDDRNDD